jgi:MoaA/NifB/PqqE/SkfB family radical SAM enzyme
MKGTFITNTLTSIAFQKQIRKVLTKQLDSYLYNTIVKNDTDNLKKVMLRKYQFLSAMLHCAVRNIDRGYISKDVVKKLIQVLVNNTFLNDEDNNYKKTASEYEEKYGISPPAFLVISPTQRCNLKCKDCYAASEKGDLSTLPYSIVDRVIGEAHDIFGSRFVTVSGGEPFLYKSEEKTLIDIFKKYNDMFFLIYTNGTLITPKIAEELEKVGNATPAISVEGFEEETDRRRGKRVYKKILTAFDNLRKAGVPFGISVTGTSENADVLLKEKFYDYYFDQEGATYMWLFQLMPIGKAKRNFELMIDPQKRVNLYRIWEKVLEEKHYCVADFWNSGVLSDGCIAYGRPGGYFYLDWDGNIMPCVFIPYYVDNVYDIYKQDKTIADALFSDFMIRGRKWQKGYAYEENKIKPKNWLMPCSIRDHYETFRKSILPEGIKAENKEAEEILNDKEYFEVLKKYDEELEKLTKDIWDKEYLAYTG